jgi:hypothetical protein
VSIVRADIKHGIDNKAAHASGVQGFYDVCKVREITSGEDWSFFSTATLD